MKGYEILLNELRKMGVGWKVRDLMTTNVRIISPEATVRKAVRDMKRYNIHGLVVTSEGEPKGIITTYDALLLMARGENGEKVKVKDIMSTEMISTQPEEDIIKAMEELLDNQLTKLPVVEGGKVVGILSATDLVDAFDKGVFEKKPHKLNGYKRIKLTVKDVMREPTIINPEKTVYDAARMMTDKGIGAVLIEKEDLIGILTEKDIFKKVVAQGLDGREVKVSDVMTAPCYTIEPDEGIGDASKLFNEHDIERLPVVEDDKIVGMISAKEIAKTIALRRRL